MPIQPPAVTLTDQQTQQFTATDAAGNPIPVTWTAAPVGAGTIDGNGLYVAPGIIAAPQDVTVTATPAGGGPASMAVISLRPVVTVLPAKVDLRANERQDFDVTVTGAANNAVTWVVSPTLGTMANGSYTAPDPVRESQVITVTARSDAFPTKTGSAVIHLLPAPLKAGWTLLLGLYLALSFLSVWALICVWPPPVADRSTLDKATAARIAAENAVKAKDEAVSKAEADKTLAQARSAETAAAEEIAKAAEVPLQICCKGTVSREIDLLLIALLAGVIGSFVHAATSFVAFAGNRTLRGSWGAWYLLHPLIGAALALIFYLVVRGGFFTTGTKGTDVNPYGIAAVSGMVGMFSKQATNKLGELFDTLFKTDKTQQMKDKLDKAAAPKP